MGELLDTHRAQLRALEAQHRLRALAPRTGLDFSSNDYLGLGGSDALRQAAHDALARGVPVGSGGSRLLRGNQAEHEALEQAAAAWFGAESALYFSSGYAANSALLATLPQRGDLIVHDELVHASAHEGMRLARAERVAATHNDPNSFDDAITRWRREGGSGTPWIAVESLYSMDGDRAPLADLAALAERHDAMLLVDEAHATGVLGPDGRGLAADLQGQPCLITLHTCGKAIGTEGALVCGPATVREFLVNRARGFIFSTAPSPLMAAVTRASLELVARAADRRGRLAALIETAATHLPARSGSQIIPVILGEDARAMQAAAQLQAAGFDVRGIRPPTVPAGTARLRVSITLNIDAPAIASLGALLQEVMA